MYSRDIINLVIEAIKNVELKYYEIITPEKKIQYRERVFCYELYHQMRIILTNNCSDLTLNGELDKNGRLNYDNEKPDFLFHIPETKINEAIIEVKNKLEEKDVIIDIEKLENFINKHEYKIGIFLLYNHSFSDEKQKIKNILEKCEVKNKEKIFIITTSNPSEVECKVYSEILT